MFQTTTMSRDRRRQAHQHLSSKMSVPSPDGALAVDRRAMSNVVVVLLFLSAAVSSSSSSTSPFHSSRSDSGNHLLNDDDSLRQPASYTRLHRLHRSRHNVTSTTTLESAIEVVPDGRTVTISTSPRPEVRAASAIWRPQTETKRPSQGHTPKGSKFIGANTRQTESFYRRNRRSVAAMHVENTATTIPSIPATTTSAMFGGLPEADVGQLDELIGRDPAAAVLEFNERVLAVGISSAKSCSMKLRYESAMDPKQFANIFKEQSVLQTANTLNNALVVTDPSSLSDSFYLALVKGLVSSDRLVYGAIIVLEPAHGNGNTPSQTPYVFKDPSTGHLQVRYVDVVRDVSRDLSSPNSTDEFAWFLRLRQNRYTDLLRYHKNVCRGGGHQSSSSSASSAAGSSATSSSSLGQSAAAYATSGTQVSVVTTAKEGLWGSPHFNCAQARSWIVALSVPFFGCIPQGVGLRGVLKVDLNLGKVDINQCSTDSRQLFSATHRCPPDTQCIHLPNGGFRRGNYRCDCLTGFYPTPRGTTTAAGSVTTSEVVSSVSTTSKSDAEDGDESSGDIDDGNVVNRSMSVHLSPASPTGINGTLLERFHVEYMLKDIQRSVASASTALADRWRCVECRCPPAAGSDCGADIGDGSGSCYVGYDALVRGVPLAVQSLCVTVTLILTVVIVRLRKTKVMKASFWCFLEVVLVGALMLYATVIIQYFEPTNATCLLIPWLREVGFAVIYGALVLKVYRVLAEFQSRKAHRVQIRDKDLFKYLLCILVVVIGYMAAWTAVTLDYVGQHDSMLQTGVTSDYLIYVVCQSKWWDYVVETAELLFMCFSIYVCYCTRAAPSNYREVRYISWTIYNEAVVSTVFYTTRHVFWLYVHPDYIFLMYFVRCQLTVTVMLLLVLGPKLWYSRRPLDDDSMRGRAYSTCEGGQDSAATPGTGLVESGKIGAVLNVNGDVDVGEINLSEMNPEDIRCELKRLYTQLQIYKTKTMRLDNPHISKRRGGRKQTHRRFSLQAFHSKHKYGGHHGDRSSAGSGAGGGGHGGGACGEHSVIGGETEVSRSPEDSVNSQEGVSVYADENSVAEMRSPTVTFKPGHRGKHTS